MSKKTQKIWEWINENEERKSWAMSHSISLTVIVIGGFALYLQHMFV